VRSAKQMAKNAAKNGRLAATLVAQQCRKQKRGQPAAKFGKLAATMLQNVGEANTGFLAHTTHKCNQ